MGIAPEASAATDPADTEAMNRLRVSPRFAIFSDFSGLIIYSF